MLEKGIQTMFATILGAVLLLVGIIGFFAAPVLGIFDVNTMHNLVHIVSGVIGIWAGVWGGVAASRWFNRIFGIVYALVAVLGFAGILVADLLNVTGPDNWLHALIGVVSLIVGYSGKD